MAEEPPSPPSPSPSPQQKTRPPPPPPVISLSLISVLSSNCNCWFNLILNLTLIDGTEQYVEVNCRSSGKTRRFAAGTDAGFAVSLINRKLKGTVPFALHIEAVKDGEEPIAFGPNSILVNFGEGWMLHTVTQTDLNFIPSGKFELNKSQMLYDESITWYIEIYVKELSCFDQFFNFLFVTNIYFDYYILYIDGCNFFFNLWES